MLNFKDWKIQSSDGNKATLRHANGHTMTIAMKALPKIQREQIKRLAKANEYKDGGEVKHYADEDGQDREVQSDTSAPQPDAQKPATPATSITINAAPVPSTPATYANQAVSAPPPEIGSVPQGPSHGVLNPNGQLNPAASAQAAQSAVGAQQAVDTAKAKAAVPSEQQFIQGYGQTQDQLQNVYGKLLQETNSFANDTKGGKINPNHYFDQMSAPKKAFSGLGLILGGLGAGQLGSTDNAALRFLNSQVDRDIQAQQQSFGNKKTILGAYEQAFGQGVTATNMARNAMLEIYKHNLDLIANKLGTPQAIANALKAKSDIGNQQQKNAKDAALDITAVPGYRPSYGDPEASNTPRGPGKLGQQGPTTAQSKPAASGMTTEDLNALHGTQEAGGPSGSGKKDDYSKVTAEPIEPILTPNAERQFLKSQYNVQAAPHKEEIARQYRNAQQTDKQLKQLNETYGELIKDSSAEGFVHGTIGRIHRTFDPDDIPTGGGDIASGVIKGAARVGSALTNTDQNRLYDANKTKLLGAISSALKGSNVGDTTIHEVVNKNAPEYGDSPGALKQKLHNITDFIKSHTETSALHPFGMSNK